LVVASLAVAVAVAIAVAVAAIELASLLLLLLLVVIRDGEVEVEVEVEVVADISSNSTSFHAVTSQRQFSDPGFRMSEFHDAFLAGPETPKTAACCSILVCICLPSTDSLASRESSPGNLSSR
jgi:hypothetical protein